MKSFRNVRVETPRLLLREFRPGDWRSVLSYARLPKVVRFMPWGPSTPALTRAFLRRVSNLRRCKLRKSYELAVILKSENRLIGACGLRVKSVSEREGDIGYCYHPDVWGNGYATEAARAIVNFGFKRLRLHRVWSAHDPSNRASGRVMRKTGMKREGYLRRHMFVKGKWRDSCLYAILDSDRRPQ